MTLDLTTLHDATLISLDFDWTNGTATVLLRTALHDELRLEVIECTDLVLSRREEWGHSTAVMSVGGADGDLSTGLCLEMQSGDWSTSITRTHRRQLEFPIPVVADPPIGPSDRRPVHRSPSPLSASLSSPEEE